jgi:hypothetical protein
MAAGLSGIRPGPYPTSDKNWPRLALAVAASLDAGHQLSYTARRSTAHLIQVHPMPSTLPQSVTISPDVLLQELNGESVLLDLKTERYYGLDDIGTRMWQLLDSNSHVEAACSRLLQEYEVDETTLKDDLAELIDKLAEAGLISVQPAGYDAPQPAS